MSFVKEYYLEILKNFLFQNKLIFKQNVLLEKYELDNINTLNQLNNSIININELNKKVNECLEQIKINNILLFSIFILQVYILLK
jgi:hypothetical protein